MKDIILVPVAFVVYGLIIYLFWHFFIKSVKKEAHRKGVIYYMHSKKMAQ